MIYAFVSLHCYVKLLIVPVKAERLFQKVVRTLEVWDVLQDVTPISVQHWFGFCSHQVVHMLPGSCMIHSSLSVLRLTWRLLLTSFVSL